MALVLVAGIEGLPLRLAPEPFVFIPTGVAAVFALGQVLAWLSGHGHPPIVFYAPDTP